MSHNDTTRQSRQLKMFTHADLYTGLENLESKANTFKWAIIGGILASWTLVTIFFFLNSVEMNIPASLFMLWYITGVAALRSAVPQKMILLHITTHFCHLFCLSTVERSDMWWAGVSINMYKITLLLFSCVRHSPWEMWLIRRYTGGCHWGLFWHQHG